MRSPELQTRHLAIEIFSAVLRNGKGLEEEFSNKIEEYEKQNPLDIRDKMFIRLLTTTMLRRLGQIDDIVGRYLQKPLDDKATYVKDVLRLSTAQLVFLDTPPHAAVSTGVALVKESLFIGFSGLTNAILRRIANDGKEIVQTQDEAILNMPDWLYHEWAMGYGEETAQKIVRAGLREAPLDFTVKGNPEKWAAELEASEMPTGTLRREKSATVPSLPGFEEGEWWVQDLSAALPVRLLGPLKGKRVIDICAAPGGKTAQLVLSEAKVTAIDVSATRVKRLKENLNRLKLDVEIVTADVRHWWRDNASTTEKFDAILLDSPCSATGTLRRHPDVIFHRTSEDVKRLNKAQNELLNTAIDMLVPGGEMVYCVCSVLPSEGKDIVNKAVADGLIERRPITPKEMPQEMITPDGDLCIFPFFYEQNGGCDGFYAARLVRKG